MEALKPTLRTLLQEAKPEIQGDTLFLRFPEGKAPYLAKAQRHKGILLPLAQAHFGVERVELVL